MRVRFDREVERTKRRIEEESSRVEGERFET
jgi:hypothetical protein